MKKYYRNSKFIWKNTTETWNWGKLNFVLVFLCFTCTIVPQVLLYSGLFSPCINFAFLNLQFCPILNLPWHRCVLREIINQDIGIRTVLSSPTDEKLKGAKIKLKGQNISLYTVFNGLEKYKINYKLVNKGSTYIWYFVHYNLKLGCMGHFHIVKHCLSK